MKPSLKSILKKKELSKEDILILLSSTDKEDKLLIFRKAYDIKLKYIGNKVNLRGLIEFSNQCSKNCLYCGIRGGNPKIQRYTVSDDEVLERVQFAWKNKFGSIVLQSGEKDNAGFIDHVAHLLKEIKRTTDNEIGITLSCGEQIEDTYQRWFDRGAHRYLLRIETSNKDLYQKIHPNNSLHSFENRMNALHLIQKIGYQTGTGVMIGLPFQTIEHLADDLLFFRELNIDMVGMGPYIEHEDTPLFQFKDQLMPRIERFNLTLKMVAILRILMKDINIAATTALQAIDPIGREKALKAGANIIMPNITPLKYRGNYLLYNDKPCVDEDAEDCMKCLEMRVRLAGDTISYDTWGDSLHFQKKT